MIRLEDIIHRPKGGKNVRQLWELKPSIAVVCQTCKEFFLSIRFILALRFKPLDFIVKWFTDKAKMERLFPPCLLTGCKVVLVSICTIKFVIYCFD